MKGVWLDRARDFEAMLQVTVDQIKMWGKWSNLKELQTLTKAAQRFYWKKKQALEGREVLLAEYMNYCRVTFCTTSSCHPEDCSKWCAASSALGGLG